MLYSASARGFFLLSLHGAGVPSDAVEITDQEYDALLAGQSEGLEIVPDSNGRPILAARAPAPPAVPAFVYDVQFADEAVDRGFITDEEAFAWVSRGELPQKALDALLLVPPSERPAAMRRFAGAREIDRLSPFITGPFKAVMGWTDAQLDGFFIAAGRR